MTYGCVHVRQSRDPTPLPSGIGREHVPAKYHDRRGPEAKVYSSAANVLDRVVGSVPLGREDGSRGLSTDPRSDWSTRDPLRFLRGIQDPPPHSPGTMIGRVGLRSRDSWRHERSSEANNRGGPDWLGSGGRGEVNRDGKESVVGSCFGSAPGPSHSPKDVGVDLEPTIPRSPEHPGLRDGS